MIKSDEKQGWQRDWFIFRDHKKAGYYKINKGLHIEFTRKPNWFHRFMTKLLLGWQWEDNK